MAVLPAVALAASVIGTGVAAYGAINTANAQSAAASAAAQQAKNNATLAQRSAADALARGDVAAQQKANQTAQLMGVQKTALAANGVDVNSGSAVDLQSDVAGNGQLDQLTIQSNAAREAAGYQAQGMNYTTQASVDEASSSNALTAGALNASSTLLSAPGAVASQWYNYNLGTRQGMAYGGVR